MKNAYDVVIIGAGPAGCSVATHVSQDLKVLMLDWSKFPRDKPCGGLLVDESQEVLRDIHIPGTVFSYPKSLGLKYVDWENSLEVAEKRGILNVSRRSFDYWLLELAKKRAEFSSETKLLEVEEKRGSPELAIERDGRKKTVKSKYVVDASGAFSIMGKKIRGRHVRHYTATQYWMESKRDVWSHIHFIYDNEITDFYSWVIPKGNHVMVGSAMQGRDITERLSLFMKKLDENMGVRGRVFRKESAMISRPTSTSDIVLGRGNVLLVGESAGLISPSTGEGISFALRSGHNCAQALNRKFGGDVFGEYAKLCKPLVEEVGSKVAKSDALSNPVKRIELLKGVEKK